jgi:hypothetical protein
MYDTTVITGKQWDGAVEIKEERPAKRDGSEKEVLGLR